MVALPRVEHLGRFRIVRGPGLACRFICAIWKVSGVRATGRLASIRSSTVMMTMDKAQRIIEAGIVKAKQIGQPMNIAVVDAGANLTAFARMDGAWLGSIDIAINKAFTAKAFDISTLELGRNSQPKDQFFGIHVSNHARVMIFAGGIPIKVSGQIVGAVGVSGGSGEQDQAVAEAAVAAWS
jgi:uncharacterized protein GlcG (DUF336 family)